MPHFVCIHLHVCMHEKYLDEGQKAQGKFKNASEVLNIISIY